MNIPTISVLIMVCFAVQPADGEDVSAQLVITNPSSAIAYGGTSHVFECVFPDSPIGNDYHEILWLYKGSGDSTARSMVGNGDVFNDQNERIIDGTIASDYTVANRISTTLTIEKVNSDAEGEYNCAIKWGKIFIESTPVSLTVREISTPPATTNVAKGAEAKLTCKASGDSVATITFHKASNDESVGPVGVSDATSGGTVTTTGVLTISGVTAAEHGIEYYCKATWSGNEVRSANVYLSVLDITGATTTVWGLTGNVAEFECRSDTLFKANANGDPYLVNKQKTYAATQISWEFFDTDDSTWKSTDTNTQFVVKTSMTSNGGVRVSPISLRDLQDNDNGLKVRCNIAYQTDLNNNFYGGTVTSGDLTLKIASITSFTSSKTDPKIGDTITLTCIATGGTAPTFSFTTGGKSTFDTTYLKSVKAATVTSVGTTHTAEYTTETAKANVLRSGQVIDCLADYGKAQKAKKQITVTTYFDCSTVTVKSFNPVGNGATVTPTDLGGGSLKQTITCPANTDTARFELKTQSNSATEITCTRETGKYDSPYLARCEETNPFSTGSGRQRMTIPTSAQRPAPCTSEATGEWSIAVMKQKLNSMTDDNCGFRHTVSCLKTGKCTLDTEKSGCRYDTAEGKLIMEYFVNLTSPVWQFAERDPLIQLVGSGRIKFWSCTGTYNKR